MSLHRFRPIIEGNSMVLSELGWDDFSQEQLCDGIPGRVASSIRERFLVWTRELNREVDDHLR